MAARSRGSLEQRASNVECRLFGHAWETFTPFGVQLRKGYNLALRCTRCHTERYDSCDKAGALTHRNYHYADGYLMGKGVERPTSDSLRLLFARVQHVKYRNVERVA